MPFKWQLLDSLVTGILKYCSLLGFSLKLLSTSVRLLDCKKNCFVAAFEAIQKSRILTEIPVHTKSSDLHCSCRIAKQTNCSQSVSDATVKSN